MQWDKTFPEALSDLHRLDFDYDDGEGIDFEPYSEFLSTEDTLSWFHAWTGNPDADGSVFRVFGQDGTGGLAAFWIVNSDGSVLEQPIVLLGSEGERGVVARDFHDYLGVLSLGHGPYEAVEYPRDDSSRNQTFEAFAKKHSIVNHSKLSELRASAESTYPGFSKWIDSQCR